METVSLEQATVEKLATADVIMAVGFGDPHSPHVLVGRSEFIAAGKSKAIAEETKILRVQIKEQSDLDQLNERVEEAKGEPRAADDSGASDPGDDD